MNHWDYTTETTSTITSHHCPKPNHIKPCWCKGVARCVKRVGVRRCRRIVKGEALWCWQHATLTEKDNDAD